MSQGPFESSEKGSEAWLVEILGLPSEVLVSQKIPKKTLMEVAAGGRGGRKLVQDLVSELRWVASLQPSNIGLPGIKDDPNSTNEIEVIWGRLRSEPPRPSMLSDLTGLIHRSIPYPIILAMTGGDGWVELSTTVPIGIESGETDRASQDRPFIVRLEEGAMSRSEAESGLSALRLGQLPRISITDLHIGWFERLLSFAIGKRTGVPGLSKSNHETRARFEALSMCGELEAEIEGLRSKAKKAKQIRTRSDLNLELKRKTLELVEFESRLHGVASARMENYGQDRNR